MLARLATVAVLLLPAVLAVPAASAHAAPASTGSSAVAEVASGPNAVSIPFHGETTVSPAEGWRFADCAAVRRASPLVVDCVSDEIRFAADEYDPEFGSALLPVALTNGRTSTTVDYIVSLAPPEPPEIALTRYAHPLQAGTPLLLPMSDLGVSCGVCGDGGALRVMSVSPASASAAATSTHLVVRAAADFAGDIEVIVRYADEYGFWSQDATITVPVFQPSNDAPFAMSVYRESASSGPTEVDLSDLVAGDDVTFLGCGPAAHGTVLCGKDGSARYVPAGDAAVDQFSFHIAQGGDQATGSVTLVPESSDLPTEGPVPADVRTDPEAEDGVAAAVIPRRPAADAVARGGLFASFLETLDRVGAE